MVIDWLSVLLEYPVHITAFAVYPALGIQVITNATEDNEEWEQAVGRLIISFGQIEYGVFAALKLRPALNLSDVTLEIPLAKKIDIALQLIKSRHEPEFEEVRQLLVEVKALTKLRNLVAHNPLVFAATHDSNGSVEVSRKITSLWPAAGFTDTEFRCDDETGGGKWQRGRLLASSSLRR